MHRKERRAARATGATDVLAVFTPPEESPLVRDLIGRIVHATDVGNFAACAKACWYSLAAYIATIPDDELRNEAIQVSIDGLRIMVDSGRALVSKVEATAADRGKTLRDLVVEGGDGVIVKSETEH
jgi:hypothetical protein